MGKNPDDYFISNLKTYIIGCVSGAEGELIEVETTWIV